MTSHTAHTLADLYSSYKEENEFLWTTFGKLITFSAFWALKHPQGLPLPPPLQDVASEFESKILQLHNAGPHHFMGSSSRKRGRRPRQELSKVEVKTVDDHEEVVDPTA